MPSTGKKSGKIGTPLAQAEVKAYAEKKQHHAASPCVTEKPFSSTVLPGSNGLWHPESMSPDNFSEKNDDHEIHVIRIQETIFCS